MNNVADYSKITLGTVQFGIGYGVSNSSGRPDIANVDQILAEARSVGINSLDTAPTYGDAETTLGLLGVSDFNIVTKIPSIPHDVHDVESFVKYSVEQSLTRLRVQSLHGLLLHDATVLDNPNASRIVSCLNDMKSSGVVRNVGVSVYRPEQIIQLDLLQGIDVIQAPVSIIDRRFVQPDVLSRMSECSVKLQARSVFLQGLLLMPLDELPMYFENHIELLTEWHRLLELNNQDAMSACISFVRQCLSINQIVLGVQNVGQLLEIIVKYSSSVDLNLYDSVVCDDEGLINPSKWNLS